MLKIIQILSYFKNNNMKLSEALDEINEIIDNGRSQYFELTDLDIQRISDVFYNESLFESAVATVFGGAQ